MKKLSVLFLVIYTFARVASAQSERLPPLNVKQYKLKNGLTVVLSRDTSASMVSVNIWYKVGSRNETAGRTGFAHLFEHLMFQGSKNLNTGYVPTVQEFADDVNGNTNADRTFYYEVVPPNFLERTLYLEADRMGTLADAIDQAKLDNQRDVVKNERRSGRDNVPYGTMDERLFSYIYPQPHPYNHPTIGSMDDLSAATLEDVKTFFTTYYVPSNAVLTLVGDFDEKQAKKWIEKYFGGIDARTSVPPLDVGDQPRISGETRKTYEDPFATFPRIAIGWTTTRILSPDEPALQLLSRILSEGRGSRLQKSLVYDKELSTGVNIFPRFDEFAGSFSISSTARAGRSIDDVEREIDIQIDRVKREGVSTDELQRALRNYERAYIFSLEDVSEKGEMISQSIAFTGHVDLQSNLDRYARVSPDDIKRVANKYLTSDRVVITNVPAKTPPAPGRVDLPTSLQSKKIDPALLARQIAMLPKPAEPRPVEIPAIQKTRLSNGLGLWVVERHDLPIVAMNLIINTGSADDPASKPGLAGLTGSMLTRGTSSRTATDIDSGLFSLGAPVTYSPTRHTLSYTLAFLTANLDGVSELLGDTVSHASFPEDEIASLKRRVTNNLRQAKTNPRALAGYVFDKVVYGEQAYGRNLAGTEYTLPTLRREDVVNFYNSNLVPNNSTLIVVGDVRMNDLKPKLEKAFVDWRPADLHPSDVPPQLMTGKPGIYIVDKPGAVQSSVIVGQAGPPRNTPDFYSILMINSLLGGQSGRLNKNLRETKGFTYGAGAQFQMGKLGLPFRAEADVQTISTKEAVVEFLKELNGIRGSIPVTSEELAIQKQALILNMPALLQTRMGIANRIVPQVTLGVPDTFFRDYAKNIGAVTLADVNRVANKYIEPQKMAIVIVGDLKVIEPRLKELGMPITLLDTDGNPVVR